MVLYFFVLVLVFVNEFVIFSFFTIFVFVVVNENHTGYKIESLNKLKSASYKYVKIFITVSHNDC